MGEFFRTLRYGIFFPPVIRSAYCRAAEAAGNQPAAAGGACGRDISDCEQMEDWYNHAGYHDAAGGRPYDQLWVEMTADE